MSNEIVLNHLLKELDRDLTSNELSLLLYVFLKKINKEFDVSSFLDVVKLQINNNRNIGLIKESILNQQSDVKIYNSVICRFDKTCANCTLGCLSNDESAIMNFCFKCDTCIGLTNSKEKFNKKQITEKFIRTLEIENAKTQKEYVSTKDRFFEVYIHSYDIKRLKYIFIGLMCRKKGIELFPDETHISSESFPVDAALYTIFYKKNKPVLHGLIRYEYSNYYRMTEKKLQQITPNDNEIKVTPISSHRNLKNCYALIDIMHVINDIHLSDYYGSSIDDFLKDN